MIRDDSLRENISDMKMSKCCASLIFCLLPVTLCSAKEKCRFVANLAAGKPQTIVTYGTSLTSHGAWVKQLQEVLDKRYPKKAKIINSGGSGKWSKWGLANLDQRVIQKNPDAVFIEFCINDSVDRFHCSAEQSKTNLETMIGRILKKHPKCEIILMTMTPGNKNRLNIATYYDLYRAVASKNGFLLIDHYSNWKALQAKDPKRYKTYIPDAIHPTPTGCKEVVTPAILSALHIDAKP